MDELVGGRYRLGALIGEGGTARVYRATDVATGRAVALKALRKNEGLVNERIERFAREMKLLQEVQSDAFIALYDVLPNGPDGRTAFVMELMEGPTLTERLKQGPLSASEVVELGTRVASGLQLAHQRGIVHGDIKPSNIYLPEGSFARAKIGDLGLAERTERATGLTQTGTVLGTPYYMSPEAAQGTARSTASDVWSLAVVLYECAYGRLPFDAPSLMGVLSKILLEAPPFPPLPNDLHRVLEHALQKQPAARFATAGAFADALRALSVPTSAGPFERIPVSAPSPAPVPLPAPASSRARLKLVIILAAILLLSLVLATQLLPRFALGNAQAGSTVLLLQALLMGVAAALGTRLVIALVEQRVQPSAALATAEHSVSKVRTSDVLTQSIAITVESLIQQSSSDPRVDLRRASLALAIDELQEAKTLGDRKAALDRAIEIADKLHEQLGHKPWYVKHKDGIALATAFAGAATALVSKLMEAVK